MSLKSKTMTARTEGDASQAPKSRKKTVRRIPARLVRETIDGIPFYYPGYRSVLRGAKTLEDIMGDSGLQSLLKTLLSSFLQTKLDKKKYLVLSGEIGLHIDRGTNLGIDIAVFDRAMLTPEKITTNYIDVPAQLVIDVDVNVELPQPGSDPFIKFFGRKINHLLDFGTPRVLWVFTQSRKILSATPGAPWIVYDWHHDVELTDGIILNLASYLKQEGFEPASEE